MALPKIVSLLITVSLPIYALVGSPCKTNEHCSPSEHCINEVEFPNGYCTEFNCSAINPCVQPAQCVWIGPDGFTVCLQSCQQNNDCRDGYSCNDKLCLPI